ncbi:MAG: hypothetical protein ACI9YE_003443 [Psychroserpens sp.]|jgi:hypothetical protein
MRLLSQSFITNNFASLAMKQQTRSAKNIFLPNFKLLSLIVCSLVYGCSSSGDDIYETDTFSSASVVNIPKDPQTEQPEITRHVENKITVLFIYSSDFANEYRDNTQLRLQQLINTANQSFADSTLPVEFQIAGTVEVEYDKFNSDMDLITQLTCDLDTLQIKGDCIRDENFSFVSSLRSSSKADIISFVRPYHSSSLNTCGLGWVTGAGTNGDLSNPLWKETAVNIINVDGPCTEWTFSHEIGHNLGLNHGSLQDNEGGVYPWAWGYGEYNSFSTIMTYQSVYGYESQRIYRFSNPNQVCMNSSCGIPQSEANAADAVSALNITIPQVANNEISVVDLLSYDISE